MANSENLVIKSSDLPKIVLLELENGSKKKYALIYTKRAGGLILNKAA